MISAKKLESYEEKKLYPTLNLVSDITVRSWFKLHNIFFEFGLKFYMEWEVLISCLFLTNCFILFIFIINNYMKILNIDKSNILFILAESVVWVLFTLMLFYKGA